MKPAIRFASLVGVLCCALGTSKAIAHPIVPGFERFYADPKADNLKGGQLLLSELNCTSCHASTDAPSHKQAPILDSVATRVRPSYLKKYLSDPQATKPGTTMPHLLHDDPEREGKIEALVQFLSSTGNPKQTRPELKAIVRGRDLFTKVGCAACHGPRDLNAEAKTSFPYAVPLGDLKIKYTIPGLTQFLTNPLEVRPGGRMPHLLKSAEARDVAHYLLQGIKTGLPVGKGTVTFALYEGSWENLPDFSKLKPKRKGTSIAFEVGVADSNSNYALRFEGFFAVEAAGKYTFHLSSDDGSRLVIDDKTIVDNDGIHATQAQSGSTELTKGVHHIRVDFFQGGGEAILDVEIEGRGLGRQALAPLVASKEADLTRAPDPKTNSDEELLALKPELVGKGKELFASLGCANCHQMKSDNKVIASIKSALPLKDLKGTGSCLSAKPVKGMPFYGLSTQQIAALTKALPNPTPTTQTPADKIAHTMLTLNCYGCHTRDKVGGSTEATNNLFLTTTPEMGEEGRLPPPLDGVGAKLNPDYFAQILDKGADDRPYMHTRMPGFGKTNVADLPNLFDSIDKLPVVSAVKFQETDIKVKSVGRQLVGAQAFGCIKCHTFAGNKAEGVQGIDMTLMPKRLKRDWFHAYCIDPQKIRPGTRMPTGWPGGQSVLPGILDGQAATQIESILVYLKTKGAPIPVGMGAKFLPLMPIGEAIIYRNFIQGAGTRAIGVGYPEKVHLAFDANDLKLAMIWKGGFIDAAKHWTDRGSGFEGPLGDDIVHLPKGPSFASLSSKDTAWPGNLTKGEGTKFLGYTLSPEERPTFRYSINGYTIEDYPNPIGKDGLRRTFKISTSADKPLPLIFRAGTASSIKKNADGTWQLDGLRLKAPGAEIRRSQDQDELLVPITLKNGSVELIIEYFW